MENKNPKNEKQTKKRSKAAKIVLFSILGCIGVMVIIILVKLIIGMAGGTGTQDGSILGLGFSTLFTVLGFLVLALVLAWLLTEPSFKKEEEAVVAVDHYSSYVKKAKTPRPLGDKTGAKAENDDKPSDEAKEPEKEAEEKTDEAETPAEETEDKAEEAKEEPAEEEAPAEEAEDNSEEAKEEPAEKETPAEEAEDNSEEAEEPAETVEEDKKEDNKEDEKEDEKPLYKAAPVDKNEKQSDEEKVPVDNGAENKGAEGASAVAAGAVAAGAVAAGTAETVFVRYRRSYMSRLIQSDEDVKAYYTDIKNKLLSYKGVHARVSWDFESFNAGRQKLAKINVKGKTITVNLALDPKTVEAKYYATDASGKAKLSDVPTLMKVKSGRSAKYTLELIEKMMAEEDIPANAVPSKETFDLEYRDNDALVKEGYIKAMYDKDVDPDGNYIEKEVDIEDFLKK